MRVLVVEDDQITAELLDGTLRQLGHEVTTVDSGAEALEYLKSNLVRLIICDWEMPKMTGTQLCRRIRASQSPHYTYFILLTSRTGTKNLVDGLRAGADEFLPKPLEPQELEQRLRVTERILSLESREMMIFGLAKLAESRDPETGMHLDRIRQYCRTLARQLSKTDKFVGIVDDEYVHLIYLTSPLHDIGKVGIPDGVLLKPGPLTETEFDIMKRHARIGAETLETMVANDPDARYLEMARDIAWSHHEKFDGSGYPRGLIGTEIPLCGRIVALADVYDALTTKRVYKPAYSHEVARSIILDSRGKHFDPDVVAAFTEAESEIVEIKERLKCDADSDDDSFCTEALLTQ